MHGATVAGSSESLATRRLPWPIIPELGERSVLVNKLLKKAAAESCEERRVAPKARLQCLAVFGGRGLLHRADLVVLRLGAGR